MKIAAISIIAALASAPAFAKDAADINSVTAGFAGALVASSLAEFKCPGMEENETAQAIAWMHIKAGGGSERVLKEQIEIYKIRIASAFREQGAEKWCSAAWTLFGPGSIMQTIRKKSP